MPLSSPESLVVGASVALGGGLLIGLERERRKVDGRQASAGGVRSFTLAAFVGALSQWLGLAALQAVGAAGVLLLSALAYWRQRGRDASLVNELALFATFLLGALSMEWPLAGAGAAVVVASVLTHREGLHRFATSVLSETELHDALLLGALALVLLPLMPRTPQPWLGGLQPHAIVLLMVLILVLQAAGHIALRMFGARLGLHLSGFFSGFVSSTATIASMGARARAEPPLADACEAGARLSTAATWVQAQLMLLAVAPAAASAFVPAAAAGFVLTVLTTPGRLVRLARIQASGPREGVDRAPLGDPAAATAAPARAGRVLRPREAAIVAAVLTGVTLVVSWAQRAHGDVGAYAGAVISGFGDAQASVLAFGGLVIGGQMSAQAAAAGVLASITANCVTRSVTAFVSGGRRFGLRLSLTLFSAVLAAWAAWGLTALP